MRRRSTRARDETSRAQIVDVDGDGRRGTVRGGGPLMIAPGDMHCD